VTRTAKVPSAELTSAELVERLRQRHLGEEWAFFAELRGGTGWTRESRADALAFNLWPSRGLELHGFEVKVSRGDWRRELANPAKAEEISRFCDRWWVVTSTDALVFPGELPPTWGWMVPHGSGLRVKVEAPKLEAKPLDRAFIAALMRRATSGDASEERVRAAVTEAQKRWESDGRKQAKRAASNAETELALLQKQVRLFEEGSGVKIDSWSSHPKQIGEAVRVVLGAGGDGEKLVRQLERLAKEARWIAENAEKAVAQWPKDSALVERPVAPLLMAALNREASTQEGG
jgi:hypothetical protein